MSGKISHVNTCKGTFKNYHVVTCHKTDRKHALTKLTPVTGQHSPSDQTGSSVDSHTDSLTYYTTQFNNATCLHHIISHATESIVCHFSTNTHAILLTNTLTTRYLLEFYAGVYRLCSICQQSIV